MPNETDRAMRPRTEPGCDFGRRICRDNELRGGIRRRVASRKEIEWNGALR
jgi:hypothetical protein